MRVSKQTRHGPEEGLANQFLDHGKGVCQGINERDNDVIAIDRKAACRIGTVPGRQARRAGLFGVKQSFGKTLLRAHASTPALERALAVARSMSSALCASASNASNAGMS